MVWRWYGLTLRRGTEEVQITYRRLPDNPEITMKDQRESMRVRRKVVRMNKGEHCFFRSI